MAFLKRRKKEPEALTGRAVVGLYGNDSVESVHVEFSGESAAIHFLVPSYFDKILFNLTAMPGEQRMLLDRVEEFVVSARQKLDRYGGIFASAGKVPLAAERPRGKPFAKVTVEAMFFEEAGRAMASTEFAPLEATNDTVAELGLWTLWDWSVAAGGGEDAAVDFLLDVLERQCASYRAHGMPDVASLGSAPFEAVTQRLAQDMALTHTEAPPARLPERAPAAGSAVLDTGATIEAWGALWDNRGEPPVDGYLWRAILDYVKELDWGHGDLFDLALRGVGDDPSMHDPFVAKILVHTACAGYFWREAEVQTDQVFDSRLLGKVASARAFIEKQGPGARTFHGREEPIEIAAAFWTMGGLAPELVDLGRDLEPALRATVNTLTNSLVRAADWEGELPAKSRDQAFLYGYALRAAQDEATLQSMAAEASAQPGSEQSGHIRSDIAASTDLPAAVTEAIRTLAMDSAQAPVLYRFVSRLVDGGFVQPLVRYLNETDETELRILSTLHLTDANVEELADVSTALVLARIQESSPDTANGSRVALELAALRCSGDSATEFRNIDTADPDFTWQSLFSKLLAQHLSIPAATIAPEMTPEMQRGGNAAILAVYAFPQLDKLIDACVIGSTTGSDDDSGPPASKPFRQPADYYDANVWWKIDLSAITAPGLAEALSELTADQLDVLSERASGIEESEREEPSRPAIPESIQTRQTGESHVDIGLAVVNAIAQMMSIDTEWSTREERGFIWWGKDHAQRVWSEPGYDDDGIEIFRLHARTPIVRDFEPSPANLEKLNALSLLVTTSGFVINADEGTVELAASMYMHAETADWVERWFAQVVAMQAADAQLKASLLAQVTGSSPATSAHPISGQRTDFDDMLNVLEQVVVPRGEDPCPWEGDDMRTVVDIIRGGQQTVMANGDGDGLTAEFPFQSRTSLLTLTTEARSPQLGNGVLSLLRLPVSFSEEDGIRFAHELNRRELSSLTRSHFLGSWCWKDDTLHFVTFLPNALYLGGADLLNFTFSCAQRARWIAETIYGDDWGANLDTSGRPLATPAMQDLVETITRERSADMITRSADGGLVCHGWPRNPHDPTSMARTDVGYRCPTCGRVTRR